MFEKKGFLNQQLEYWVISNRIDLVCERQYLNFFHMITSIIIVDYYLNNAILHMWKIRNELQVAKLLGHMNKLRDNLLSEPRSITKPLSVVMFVQGQSFNLQNAHDDCYD